MIYEKDIPRSCSDKAQIRPRTHYSDVIQTGKTCWLFARMAAIACQHPRFFTNTIHSSDGKYYDVDLWFHAKKTYTRVFKQRDLNVLPRKLRKKITILWPQAVLRTVAKEFKS